MGSYAHLFANTGENNVHQVVLCQFRIESVSDPASLLDSSKTLVLLKHFWGREGGTCCISGVSCMEMKLAYLQQI